MKEMSFINGIGVEVGVGLLLEVGVEGEGVERGAVVRVSEKGEELVVVVSTVIV